MKYWKLELLSISKIIRYNKYYLCKCDCWNIKEVRIDHLKRWEIKSCWCIERKSWLLYNIKTHWKYKTRIYSIWHWLKNRCNNKNYIRYKDYWWRWITYDKKWENFEWFYEDMIEWYNEYLTIDRINNNWNYCKENCRWVSNEEQQLNRRNNRILDYMWEKLTISQWWKKLWIKPNTISVRLFYWKTIEQSLKIN